MPISVVQQSNSVICIYTLFSYILFHYALSEDIIFLCAVYSRTCCMPVPNVIVCTCQPQTPSVPTSPSPPLLHFLTLSSWALACAIPSKQLLWMSTIIFFFKVVCLLLIPTSSSVINSSFSGSLADFFSTSQFLNVLEFTHTSLLEYLFYLYCSLGDFI